MTVAEQLLEAEHDLDQLIIRASNCLPTLRRVADDAASWRKDITHELNLNLEKAIELARENQARRRRP